jgi:streptomycin 6-kinase
VREGKITVPAAFAAHVHEVFGEPGRGWLARLPSLIGELARAWGLAVGEPFDLSYNYVAPARRDDGSEAVLKVSCPDPQLALEALALRCYDGDGACRLLATDEARYALLLERLRPGGMLATVAREDDAAATRIGARVMRRLWRPVPEGASLRPIREWFEGGFARHRAAHGGPGPLPARLFERAERLAVDLLDSAPADRLLHGDFHHYNVLSAEREAWLAIDPKGMRGDPGYEAGPFLLNPSEVELTPGVLARRLDVLAEELGYDRARLREWGIAHAVLSAIWSAEDEGHGWEGAVAVGEALAAL